MEWGALVLPILLVGLAILFFAKRLVWWELAIPLVVSILLILGSKSLVEFGQTQDTEYWGGWAVHARYFEDWDEEVPCTHWECASRDKDGNCTSYRQQHAYDVDYHPEYWDVIDNNGITVRISRSKYTQLCQRWGDPVFVDLRRNYHSNDGDLYQTTWDERELSMEVVATIHTYENRVQVASTVYNYPEVPETERKQKGLIDYPKIVGDYYCPSILGAITVSDQKEADRRLEIINGKFGRSKQIRVFVLLFKDQPLETAHLQEAYWKGGNKNELNICIGLNDRNEVQWAHVFSWTTNEALPVMVRNEVYKQQNLPLDLVSLAKWLEPTVSENWVRKHFREFRYLEVEPPGWSIVLIYILTGLASLGCVYWALVNEFGDEYHSFSFRDALRWKD